MRSKAPTCDQNPIGNVCCGASGADLFLLLLRFFLLAIIFFIIVYFERYTAVFIKVIIAKFTTFCNRLMVEKPTQ